jgi:hypothetical protein
MKLTKTQALEKSIALWTWLVKNPGKPKSKWPGFVGVKIPESECYLCEHCEHCSYSLGDSCDQCLLFGKWPIEYGKGNGYVRYCKDNFLVRENGNFEEAYKRGEIKFEEAYKKVSSAYEGWEHKRNQTENAKLIVKALRKRLVELRKKTSKRK